MSSTMTERHCEIVPCSNHSSDGVVTEWAVRDPWAEKFRADGFQSAEAAIDWATGNGYTPDLRLVAAHRLEQALNIMGPYDAAQTVVSFFSVHQLVRFGLEFRRSLDARITAEDNVMDAASEMF